MGEIFDPQALRRELHAIPELAMHEEKTSAYVMEKLREIGLEPKRVGSTTGVVAEIKGAEPGPVMLLRADMDALPFTIEGKPCAIHACGHDGHTAMLLAAASRLVGRVKRGTLRLLFQPAEETIQGALEMIKAGVADDVDFALGAHIRPIQDVPLGKICAAVNHTASSTAFVTVKGRDAHASRPHLGINAIDAACAIVQAVQAIWLDPRAIWSMKATQLHADSGATNTVPAKATITYDVRTETNALMAELQQKMKTAVEMSAAALGAEASIDFRTTCPAAVYDPDFKGEVAEAVKALFGEDALAPDCGGGGEDFHFFKLHKPSMKAAYFGVGVGAKPGLHAATMDFDGSKLAMGVAVFEKIVLDHLG